jgi:hypothetical protein
MQKFEQNSDRLADRSPAPVPNDLIPIGLLEAVSEHWAVLGIFSGDGNTERDDIPPLLDVVVDIFSSTGFESPQPGISLHDELKLLRAALFRFGNEKMSAAVTLALTNILLDAPVTLRAAAEKMRNGDDRQWEMNDPQTIEGVERARNLTDGASFLKEDIVEGLENSASAMEHGGTWTDLYNYESALVPILPKLEEFKLKLEGVVGERRY